MQAPLLDSRGNLRYFIGAQIDVSGLVKDATDLDAFRHIIDQEEGIVPPDEARDEFQELSEMFNQGELDTVRRFGGSMHRDQLDDGDDKASTIQRPRLLIRDQSTFEVEAAEKLSLKPEGRLAGPYKHVSPDTNPLRRRDTDQLAVPSRSPCPLPAYPLHIPLPPRPRNPAIALPRPHRRFPPRARICTRRARRRITRRNSKGPLVAARSAESRNILRRRAATMDSLHSIARSERVSRYLDGRHCRRREIRAAESTIQTGATGRE